MTYDLNTLKLVNTKVNLLEYKTQIGDDWNPFTANGFDCNNYATRKMEELAARGVPVLSMRLATCFVEPFRGEDGNWVPKANCYHAVLLVDINDTTYVLDNRHPLPMEFELLPYEFHKIQVAGTQQFEWAVGADRSFG